MTLIEIGVALCVAGLMLAIAIPAIGAVTRAQLRQKSGQLAGAIRSMYGAAAIAGHTCRLVLDLDGNSYWSECAKSNVRLDREGERSQNGARVATREEELQQDAAQREGMNEEEKEKLALAQKSAFAASADVPKTDLGGSVKFTDVWVQHQPERYTTGKAFVYFWSSGLTEETSIHLAQGDDVFSLIVAPLTGRVKVVGDRVDAPGQRR
ncbi:MAG: Tfp pilus assembly protein FimT/FimU [Myxococcales bacterium]|nr:type II secretion system GspH family protein [Myxococcales bacterium]